VLAGLGSVNILFRMKLGDLVRSRPPPGIAVSFGIVLEDPRSENKVLLLAVYRHGSETGYKTPSTWEVLRSAA
jgi:hypothetical protein